MTASKVFLLLSLALSIGCSPYPRYRTGGGEEFLQAQPADSHDSVNSRIRFGRILQSYLGKPYVGRSKYEKGLDCSLFAGEVYHKFAKIELPRTVENQYQTGSKINLSDLRFGDLVFFITDGRKVSHVGIYTGYNEFIHASTSSGVIISRLNDKYWSKRFAGARRVIE